MVHFEGEFGMRVLQRLQQEMVIWLTSVSADGTPQPNPVWFYWDSESCLIYSQPQSVKVRNIARNPRVALNFEGASALGGDVIVLTGDASLDPHPSPPPEGYTRKYDTAVKDFGYTWEQLQAEFSVAIRVKPTRYRGI